MEAQIISFRRGVRTQCDNQMILAVKDVADRDAATKLVGKKVKWVADGKNKTTINGEIVSAHGNKGAVRAIFERGLPGQSICTTVSVA